jgi:hypothetical protein
MKKDIIKLNGKCAPIAFGNYTSTLTCLAKNELITLAALYNNNVSNKKNRISKSKFKDVAKLIEDFNKKLSTVCKPYDDHCWINQPFLKTADIYKSIIQNYRPSKPKEWETNYTAWLNTYDILVVMNQYEKSIQNFSFLGVFPVDFMETYNSSNTCIIQKMCTFNLKSLIDQGKEQIGFVINLDKHDRPGSHWVCMYANIKPSCKKFGVCYYDSLGYPYNRYIETFITVFKKQATEYFDSKSMQNFKIECNRKQHQYKNTECGMYAMIFIILCLENNNETYQKTINRIKIKSDEFINSYRNKLYAPTM